MWGYSWEAGQSKQVVYQAADSHIHELYVTLGGNWQHADLTAITGADVGYPFHGYSWEAGQSKQVVYQAADSHIHELYVTLGGNWQHADLTALTGAPNAGWVQNGYSWEAGQSKQVVYTAGNDHIYELYKIKGGTWKKADLTAQTGAPLVGTTGYIGYSWEGGQSKQVAFGTDGHVHELSKVKGARKWQHADLTDLVKAFHFNSSGFNGYSWEGGQSKQVVFSTVDGHIHELRLVKKGTWQHADLTAITGAPPVENMGGRGNGYSWEAGQSRQVVFRTVTGHIHELYVVKGGTWQRVDLTDITGAPPAKRIANGYSWEGGQSKQVVYSTADGHIHELFIVKGGNWQHADLTAITGAPPAKL